MASRTEKNLPSFQHTVLDFYAKNKRSLPWRKTKNPYHILVSEVMLQQTQVSRVLQKYPEFLKKFPTITALHKAPLSEVLAVWQGMGYNRRALALKRIADEVTRRFHGKIPQDRKDLESLPGIGAYTAGAIRTFAWNEPEVFIETNIRRVFIHHFFQDREGIHDKELFPLIEQSLDQKDPRTWCWALMDYGSELPRRGGNANTKSKHYVRQSTFKGSRRQVRGNIIKLLTKEAQTLAHLKKELVTQENLVEHVIKDLMQEGFIHKQGRLYAIKE